MVRNHYVPQHYLRGFSIPGDRVFIYEKGNTNIRCTNVKNAAVEGGFYSDEIEIELNAKIETPANNLLDQLRGGEIISSENKLILAEYMVSMMKRTPKGWLRLENKASQIADKVFKETEEYIRNCIRESPHERDIWERRWLFFMKYIEEWKVNPSRDVWYSILHANKSLKVIETLSKLVWIFYRSEKPVFLTSDNPVFYPEAIGIGKAVSEVSFPISSAIALEATNLVSCGMTFYSANEAIVQRINRRTVQNATRYIFHCEDDPKVLQLINAKN